VKKKKSILNPKNIISEGIFDIIKSSSLVKMIKAAGKTNATSHLRALNQSMDDLEKSLNAGKKPEKQIKLHRIKLIDFFRK
jgi:hypothetical protein